MARSGLTAPTSPEAHTVSTKPSRPARATFSSCMAGPLVTTPMRHPAVRSRPSAACTSGSGPKNDRYRWRYSATSASTGSPSP